ncbi:phage holin family protein [Streptomyces bobili]|uniref:Phage holin family protein n=1 Tax=Streptomyces bobili TaxID=67280 RepID=A0ABZ1RBI8_9ACTN|nr:phage holin family protein [Streptomyces bobili]
MVLLFLSLAAVLGLATVMDGGWAALIVTAVWAVVAAVLYQKGRGRISTVSPKPERTVETLTSSPPRGGSYGSRCRGFCFVADCPPGVFR